VRVVLPYEGKYLLEKLTNPKWPENLGKRRFVGGGIDGNETPEQAAARELFEELGVKVKPTAFRALGPDNREGQSHVQYLELPKHNIKPGVFNATVGSDAQITLEHGMPEGHDYYGPDIKTLLAPALKKTAKDLLPGGKADNVPDREVSQKALAEGAQHEHEHTANGQIAKEIAKDHLSEDPRYYKKIKQIEKTARPKIIQELLAAKNHSDNKRYGHKSQILRKLMEQAPQDWVIDDSAPKFQGVTHTPTKFRFHTDRTSIPTGVKAANTGSVYGNQLQNTLSMRQPIVYDHTKPVFENVKNHLAEVKRRGDFMLQAQRNHQQYRAALDPKYRYQLAMQAFRGQMEQPAFMDQIIERYGNDFLNIAGAPR
jgi:8-oxo-dGTP pyrophosphatase MutT (NUDIX family)